MIVGGTTGIFGGYMWLVTGGGGYEDITTRDVARRYCNVAIGIGLLIGGAVHDRNKRYGWGIVSPKSNEIGIAYNFK
jgi:hypothetical protein